MRINHNIAALNTHRQMSAAQESQGKSMEKLSSGLRINRAGDDAAGLAISEKMRGQIRGLDMASKNAQDSISMIQTAEGALNETHSILQRMRELAVQAGNDTSTDGDRASIQKEVAQLKNEIDRISGTTEFNTKKLLNGDLQGTSRAQGTKLESMGLQGTNTQGNSTGAAALQSLSTISKGVNDNIKLSVDGGTVTEITITQGQYDQKGLVAAVNDAIGKQSALAGKVTAELDKTGKLAFISASTGTASSVAVTAGTKSADTELGFAAGSVTSNVANKNIANTTLSATVKTLDLTLGGKTITNVDLTLYGMNIGDVFGKNAASVTALQKAFDDNFGKGAVTVAQGAGATELSFTSSLGTVAVATGTANGITAANISAGTTVDTAFVDTTFNAGTKVDGAAAQLVATGGTSGSTRLVALGDSDGNNLGLKTGNQINISVIVGGQQKTGTFAVTGTNTLQDLADAVRNIVGGTTSVSIDSKGQIQIAGQQGESFAVSNLKLTAQVSATDTTAVSGKFSEKMSAYKETQEAKDVHNDSSAALQIGANQDQKVNVDINEMSVKSLSLSSTDVSTSSGAQTAITVVNNALEKVSAERSKLGAFQNRLEHTINNLTTSSENLTAAESRVRDVDMAKEMMNQTKNSILAQAAQAMLAQANQQPQGVLQLLR